MGCASCGCAEGCCPEIRFFSGLTNALTATSYLADAGVGIPTGIGPNQYVSPKRYQVSAMMTNLQALVIANQTVRVVIRKNGVDVLAITYSAGEGGTKRATLGEPITFSPKGNGGIGDVLDIAAVLVGGALTAYPISGAFEYVLIG